MTTKISVGKFRRVFIILSVSITFSLLFQQVSALGSLQLNRNEFNKILREALLSIDNKLVDSLILNNRLLVKPFIDGLITETIRLELNGSTGQSKKNQELAERAALSFERIFREKSLSIGVSYLTKWTGMQKKEKLFADSLNIAGTQIMENDPAEAVQNYRKALAVYKNIGDERGESVILGALALYYYNSGDFGTAYSFYKNALKARVKVDDKQLIGNSLQSIGIIYLNHIPDFEKAFHHLDSAETVRIEIGDKVKLGQTTLAKASALEKLNHLEEAIIYFRKSSEINQVAGDEQAVAESWSHIGNIMNLMGNYSDALESYDKAMSAFTKLDLKSGICEVLIQTGFVYSNLGDYDTAVQKLSDALQVSKGENDKRGIAGAYNNLGIVLQNAGRPEKARDYFDNSLKIYEELGDQLNTIGCLSNLGTVYNELKDYSKAADTHLKGLELSVKTGDRDVEAICLLNLANDLLGLKRVEESMSCYKKGIEIARSLNSPELIWKSYAGMAEIHEQGGEFEKAVELNDTALKFLDGIRNTIKDNKLKASFMAAERYAFEDIISMLADLHLKYPDKGYDLQSFNYAEKSKSRVLLDLLADSSVKVEEGVAPISVKDVQEMCPDKNTVIIEYSTGDSSSCMWVITKSEFKLFKLPDRKKIQEQVETIRFALLDPTKETSSFFIQPARSLYKELIEPAEPFLNGKSKLVIIPDGILNYLPYEVLLYDNVDLLLKKSYSELPYLIKKCPLSYAQSTSVLKNLLSEHAKAGEMKHSSKKLIAFGDPVYGGPEVPKQTSGEKYNMLEYSGQ